MEFLFLPIVQIKSLDFWNQDRHRKRSSSIDPRATLGFPLHTCLLGPLHSSSACFSASFSARCRFSSASFLGSCSACCWKESTCMFSAMVKKAENWIFRWNPELIIDCVCVLDCNAPWGIVPEPIIGCACVPKGNTPWGSRIHRQLCMCPRKEHTLHHLLMCRCITYMRWVNGTNAAPIIVEHRILITFQMCHLSK